MAVSDGFGNFSFGRNTAYSAQRRLEELRREQREQEKRDLIELSKKPEPLYRILAGENPAVLQEKVEFLLSIGWECKGGVACPKENRYIQSMFKPRTEPIPEEGDNHFPEVNFTV